MKKRYTSDPKQAFRRNAFTKQFNKIFLALLALLFSSTFALGQSYWTPSSAGTYYLRSTGSGNNFDVYSSPGGVGDPVATNKTALNGKTISSGVYTLVFENTATINMVGQFLITAGAGTEARLNLQLGTAPGTPANPTLKITGENITSISDNNWRAAFFLNSQTCPDSYTEHSITIQGNSDPSSSTTNPSALSFNNNFIIDGDGPVLETVDGNTMAPKARVVTAGNAKNYGMFRIQRGTLKLEHVTIQNFSNNWTNGGVIQVFTNPANNAVNIDINHCKFTSIATRHEGVMRLQSVTGTYTGDDKRKAVIKYSLIEKTYGIGAPETSLVNVDDEAPVDRDMGTLRSYGNNKIPLEIQYCHLTNNYGCAVRWHGCGDKGPMKVYHCLIENNFTLTGENVNGGGGLLLKGPADIQDCTIQNNRTNGNGGGIYVSTYTDFNDGTSGYVPDHNTIELDNNTTISNNVADGNGGGVAVEANLMRNTYGSLGGSNGPNGYIWNGPDSNPYTVKFVLGGATISGNTAIGNGGGVSITRPSDATFYKIVCELDKGTISSNQAVNGGGVAIVTSQSFINPATKPSSVKPQNIIVEVSKANEDSDKILIQENNASANGGGVYVKAYAITYDGTTSEVSTTIFDYSDINHNTAGNDGGGLYVERGTVTVKKAGTKVPIFQENNADVGDGGGIYVDKGIVKLNGGKVYKNNAAVDGGGIYVGKGYFTTDLALDEPFDPGDIPPLLPVDFVQLEYIKSTGSQWIDLGLKGKAQHTIYCDGYAITGGNNALLYAYQNTDNRLGCRYYTGTVRAALAWRRNSNGHGNLEVSPSSVSINLLERFQMYQNKNKAIFKQGTTTFDPDTYNSSAAADGEITATWKLFYYDYTHRGVLYEAKIWEDATIDPSSSEIVSGGTLVAHLIPCKNPGGQIGVYDAVRHAFFTNSGSGVFEYGELAKRSNSEASLPSESEPQGSYAYTTRDGEYDCIIQENTAARDGGGIYLNEGHVYMKNSQIKDNTATNGRGGGVYTNAGNIYINYWPVTMPAGSSYTLVWAMKNETTPTEIKGNKAGGNGGGVNTHEGRVYARGTAYDKLILFEDNIAGNSYTSGNGGGSGGGVMCMGQSGSAEKYIQASNVKFKGNEAHGGGTTTIGVETISNGSGGGVYLQHGVIDMNRVIFEGNQADKNGGGINNHSGTINLAGALIGGASAAEGNVCDSCGGGVYTNSGNITVTNHTANGTFYPSFFKYNKAKYNGGGINTHSGEIDVVGTHDHIIDITYNEATKGSGGGAFCMGGTGSGYYIDLEHVNLCNNEAKEGTKTNGGVTYGCGGGIYLQQGKIKATNVTMQNNRANKNGGAINNHDGSIEILGCLIGGGASYGNVADSCGGGIYTHYGDIDIEDYRLSTSGTVHLFESKITHNSAALNGGGLNTHSGTIWINDDENGDQIEISHNTADKGGGIYANQGTIFAHDALINNNTAQTNGGGIDNRSGNITLYGGQLSNNTAVNGKGGGAYTNVGDIRILPYPSDNGAPISTTDGTKIYNNLAKMNGGGINNHTGRVDVRYATLYNNTSTLGNGGGIFCEGPHSNNDRGLGFTIRLMNSDMIHNKTRGADGTEAEPTGRGGGIYLKYGSIFAQSSNILNNSANINGGGLDNHEGSILVYGCNLIGNKAVTGRGGGIYTEHGNITTGPSLVNSSSQATVVQSNYAKVNGGGINNHQGSFYLNGDHILDNIAETGEGGGIYIANGTIDMYGGKIANNKANQGKGGGVYSGGGTFNIQKREGKPVIQIIDVDTLRANKTYIHYHLIDKGNNESNPVSHGIKIIPGASSAFDSITFSAQPAGFGDSDEGCYRILRTDLTAESTYKVVAWAKFTKSTVDYIGWSDTTYFTVYGNKPTVITGSANNITTNSAEFLGKVIDNGSTAVTERGIYYGTSKNDISTKVNSDNSATYITASVDVLSPATKYYYQAFARNGAGEARGAIDSLTTAKVTVNMGSGNVVVTAIGSDRATFTFTMPSVADLTNWGFVLSTDDDPELHDDADHNINKPTITGNIFTATKDGLDPATIYYVRAYATTEDAESGDHPAYNITNYSLTTPVQFITTNTGGKPTVLALRVSDVTQHSADITGKLQDAGSSAVTNHGIVWSKTNPNPEMGASECYNYQISGAPTEEFTLHMPEGQDTLTVNRVYYVRAYATNGGGTAYSNQLSFTTMPLVLPVAKLNVEDLDIYSTNKATARFAATFTNGGSTYNSYGYRYGDWEAGAAVLLITAEESSPSADTYEWTINTFERDKEYWAVAYVNTAFGSDVSDTVRFTTPVALPDIEITSIASNWNVSGSKLQVPLTATVNSAGDKAITRHGFLWSTLQTPAPTLGNMSDERDNFYHNINGSLSTSDTYTYTIGEAPDDGDHLFSNRWYYVRPFATTVPTGDLVGTSPYDPSPVAFDDSQYTYGPVRSVLTLPKVFTGGYSDPVKNSTSAILGFNSPSPEFDPANPTIVKVGVCYKTGSGDPTTSDLKVEETYSPGAQANWIKEFTVTGLSSNTSYKWRAYIINTLGNIAYSGTKTVTTTPHTLDFRVNHAEGGNVTVDGLNSLLGWDGSSTAFTVNVAANPGWYINDNVYCDESVTPAALSSYDDAHSFGTLTGSTIHTTWGAGSWNIYFKVHPRIIVDKSGDGSVTYEINDSGSPAALAQYPDTLISMNDALTDRYTLVATPASGYAFANWTDANGNVIMDGVNPVGATYIFTASGPVYAKANFVTRGGRGNATSSTTTSSRRSRDIYPAPAREPWDWDEDDCTLNPHGGQGSAIPCAEGSTLRSGDCGSTPAMKGFGAMSTDTLTQPIDSIAALRERLARTVTPPQDVPLILGNTADYGGGIYMTNDDPAHPTTLVFSGGSSASDKGRVILNHANKRGGGIYIDDKAYMQMKGHCEVNYNNVPADSLGGGIFLLGRLYVGSDKNAATDAHALAVYRNYDIASMGLSTADSANIIADNGSYTPSFTIRQRNNIYLPKNEYHWETGNSEADNDLSSVITLLSDISGFTYTDTNGNGSYDSGEPRVFYSNIGFSVPRGSCPVIATADGFGRQYMKYGDTDFTTVYEPWMTALMPPAGSYNMSNSAVFDDSESYMALHTRVDDEPFRAKYIYLWGCWTNPYVFDDPEIYNPMEGTGSGGEWCEHYKILNPEANTNDPSNPNYNTPLEWEIYSEKGLSWFSSYVNGLNVFKDGDVASGGNHLAYRPEKNPKANAVLKADLDMSEYFWVPIGSVTQYEGINQSNIFTDNEHHNYQGVFDGQGHTVKGIVCRLVTGINKMGLFGHLAGDAKVKNVFIDEAMLIATNPAETYHIGSVAGIMSGNATVSACEARAYINITDAQKATSYAGGLVGKAENGATNVIHSSMALPDITGVVDYMGGLVGYLGTGNKLYNSFSNPHFPKTTDPWYSGMTGGKYIGGLVGVNAGTVENCYSRLQGTEPTNNGTTSVFGWLAGDNGGTINYSYAPQANISGGGVYKRAGSEPTGHGTYTATERFSGKYGFKHRDQAVAASNSYINNDTLTGGLQHALNAWVKDKGKTTYHPWMRTMASTINDDLPILNFLKESGAKALTTNPLYNAVGSKDGLYMDYNTKVDTLLKQYTAIDEVLIYPTPAIYLYDSIMNGAIPDSISYTNIGTTHPNVMLAINENVGILVNGTAASNGLKARVGVTIRNARQATDPTDPNWHLFSSAVDAADAPVGLKYNTDDATTIDMSSIDGYSNATYAANIVNNATKPQHLDNVYGVRQYFDPPQTQWYQSDNSTPSPGEAPYDPSKVGYFPTNTPYGTWRTTPASTGFFDLYAYSEPHYHWINFKREGSASYMDHWHMDPEFESLKHYKINYTNEENMPVGKGYLMALSEESMMMTDGVLNTGNKSVTVTHTNTSANTPPAGSVGTYNYNLPWRSLNLIGNPYQSYLDFDLFHNAPANADIIDNVYGTREDGIGDYIYYTNGQSSTPFTASKFIHPHQGFFVKKTDGEGSSTLTFTDAMRVAGTSTSLTSPYRNQMNYPLVVLLSYDSNGGRDLTTVEVNRPELGGGGKMHSLRTSNASVYACFEDKDWQTLFTPEGVSEVPVRFEAFEDSEYTFNWETYHGDFSYLHLIDNLAGKDIDCLSATEYKFEGKTTDYHSRFKLVFQCTGVEENTDDATTVNFAFQHEDELIVNGEGQLEMFDITGRRLMNTQAVGEQSHYSLPKVAAGVYLLRLSSNQQVKIQKIILQ